MGRFARNLKQQRPGSARFGPMIREFRKNIKGRGASHNTDSRFESTQLRPEAHDADEFDEKPLLRTEFIRDLSKSVVSENTSPDLPFRYSLNPYRAANTDAPIVTRAPPTNI